MSLYKINVRNSGAGEDDDDDDDDDEHSINREHRINLLYPRKVMYNFYPEHSKVMYGTWDP